MNVAAVMVASAIAAAAWGVLLWLISRTTVLPDTGRTSAPPRRPSPSTRSAPLFAALSLPEKRAALDISPVVYQAAIDARLGNVEMTTTTTGWGYPMIERMTDDDLRAGVRLGILARRAVAEDSSVESIKIFEAIVETAPFDSISTMSIGTRYHMIGDRRRSLEYMQTALRMDPTNSRIRMNLHRLTQDERYLQDRSPSGNGPQYDPGRAAGDLCTGDIDAAVLLARRALEIIAVIDETDPGPPRSTWIDDTLHDDRAPRGGWSVTEASEALRLTILQDSREFEETEFAVSSKIDDGALAVQITSVDRRRDRSHHHQIQLGSDGFSLSGTAPDPVAPDLPARTGGPSTPDHNRTLIDGTDQDDSAHARSHVERAPDPGHRGTSPGLLPAESPVRRRERVMTMPLFRRNRRAGSTGPRQRADCPHLPHQARCGPAHDGPCMMVHKGGCDSTHPVCPNCHTEAIWVMVPTTVHKVREYGEVILACSTCEQRSFRYDADLVCDTCDWLVPDVAERLAERFEANGGPFSARPGQCPGCGRSGAGPAVSFPVSCPRCGTAGHVSQDAVSAERDVVVTCSNSRCGFDITIPAAIWCRGCRLNLRPLNKISEAIEEANRAG